VPLLLDGWDRASIWGWDSATGSLYAHLCRNVSAPDQPLTIQIGPDELTPAITVPATLAQHIAMAAECDPWDAIAAMDEVRNRDEEGKDWDDEEVAARSREGSTAVTMTEGYDIWWPRSFGSRQKRSARS